MQVKVENRINENIVYVSGRIDTSNVSVLNDVLIDPTLLEKKILIDFQEVEYISSSGLRSILTLAKKQKELVIINTSLEVYEIFQVTGFTEILNVKKAFKNISVEGCPLLGKGTHGEVYRLNDETIAKVYREDTTLEEVELEKLYAKCAFISGIPTAMSFDIAKCDGRYVLIFELIDADSLGKTILNNPDKYEDYASKYARLLRTINTTKADTSVYRDIKEIYHERIKLAAEHFTEEEIQFIDNLIDAVPDGDTLIHTDFHPNNIMECKGEIILIDLADLCYGDPIFDIGAVYMIMVYNIQNTKEMMKAFMPEDQIEMGIISLIGVGEKQARDLWERAVKEAYAPENDAEFEKIQKKCEAVALLRTALKIAIMPEGREDVIKSSVELLRKELFPNIDDYISLMKN